MGRRIRVKVDEDLPKAVTAALRERGYDAASVVEQQMSGWSDDAVWQAVQDEGRFLVTADKGFADVRRRPPGTHAGILLLRPAEESVRTMTDLLSSVLDELGLQSLSGTVAVAAPGRLRIRKPSPQS